MQEYTKNIKEKYMFKKIKSSITLCVIVCTKASLAMYPAAVVTTANNSDFSVLVSFTAEKNTLGYEVYPGFCETRGSSHKESIDTIHHAYELSNDTLKIEYVMNELQESTEIPLSTDPEYTITSVMPGSTITCAKKCLSQGGFTSDGCQRTVSQYYLTITVHSRDEK